METEEKHPWRERWEEPEMDDMEGDEMDTDNDELDMDTEMDMDMDMGDEEDTIDLTGIEDEDERDGGRGGWELWRL